MTKSIPTATKVEAHLLPTVKVMQEDFDEKRLSQCVLCLEIDEARFRFCFVESKTKLCLWLEDYAFDTFLNAEEYLEKLKSIVDFHPYLKSDQWKEVRVAANSPSFTLVPDELFKKEYAANYLELAVGSIGAPEDRFLINYLSELKAHNVFSIPTPWSDWLLELYPLQKVEFCHLTSALILGSLSNRAVYEQSVLITLYLENNYFTIIHTQDSQLKFCNRFPYANALELTYLVLFSMNQLQLLPDEVYVKLYGEITPFSDVYTELSKFLPNLHFGKGPATLTYHASFEEIPEHRYFGLLNTFQISS